MMEKVSFSDVLGKAWTSFVENWWAWLGVYIPAVLITTLINFGVTWLRITNPELEDMFTILSLPTLIFLIFGGFALLKYSLTLVRQPELVKANFFQAIWYSIRDGYGKRLLYAFYSFLLMIGIGFVLTIVLYLLLFVVLTPFLMGIPEHQNPIALLIVFLTAYSVLGGPGHTIIAFLTLVFFTVIISLVVNLIISPFSLTPYIIQDTLSDDNQSGHLSFFACFGKSFQLMRGHKLRYAVLFTVIGAVTYYIDNLILNTLTVDWFSLIIAFLLVSLTAVPAFIISAVWADELIADDDEIADFGDY